MTAETQRTSPPLTRPHPLLRQTPGREAQRGRAWRRTTLVARCPDGSGARAGWCHAAGTSRERTRRARPAGRTLRLRRGARCRFGPDPRRSSGAPHELRCSCTPVRRRARTHRCPRIRRQIPPPPPAPEAPPPPPSRGGQATPGQPPTEQAPGAGPRNQDTRPDSARRRPAAPPPPCPPPPAPPALDPPPPSGPVWAVDAHAAAASNRRRVTLCRTMARTTRASRMPRHQGRQFSTRCVIGSTKTQSCLSQCFRKN